MFRLAWSVPQVVHFRQHARVLQGVWRFWLALVLKLIPGAWPWPIPLRLRDNGVFRVREFMTLYIYREIFVDRCYDVTLPTHRPQIVDIGANTGLFVLRMKQLFPQGRIRAFEPAPANFAALNETIELNSLHDVQTFQQGVAGQAGSAALFLHSRNIGGHSLYADQTDDSGRSVQIDLVTLESAVGGGCDLLKLDCEGAEYEILMSMNESVAARVGAVIFEATPSKFNADEIRAHLERLGFVFEARTFGRNPNHQTETHPFPASERIAR